MGLKEQLLGLKLKRVEIPAPELGDKATLTVQQPSVGASERLDQADFPKPGTIAREGRLQRWVRECLIDADGSRVFSDKDDLSVIPSQLMQRIFDAAYAMTNDESSVKAEAKNSSSVPPSSSAIG